MGWEGRGYGYIKDVIDWPEKYAAQMLKSPVETVTAIDFSKELPPIYDQLTIGSCQSNALGAAIEYNIKSSVIPSRLLLYYNARKLMGTVNTDSGSTILAVFQAAKQFGVCDETLWPYISPSNTPIPKSEMYVQPPATVYAAAKKDLLLKLLHVRTMDDLKHALSNKIPVVCGMQIYSFFESAYMAQVGVLQLPQPQEKYIGGHALLFCGFNDATKEFKLRNSWGCYSSDTEVLTSKGWKLFKNIKKTDLIATLSESGFIEYHPYKKYHKYSYNGNLFNYHSSKIDFLVTPNHNMYVFDKSTNLWTFKKAENMNNKRYKFKRNAKWRGINNKWFMLPACNIKVNKNTKIRKEAKKIRMTTWVEFLGYYLSEGHTSYNICKNGGKQYCVGISQVKKSNREKIALCLTKLGYSFYTSKTGFVVSDFQLWKYMSKFKKQHKRYIPNDIKQLPSKKLKILYDALMLGDGSVATGKNGSNKVTYYTISKRLADDIQEVVLKIGLASSIHIDDRVGSKTTNGYNYICYQIRIQGTKSRSVNATIVEGKTLVPYKGNVYCLTVPNHTLYVRRNGKSGWCGNSLWGQQGYFEAPYEYIENPELTSQMYAVIKMEK